MKVLPPRKVSILSRRGKQDKTKQDRSSNHSNNKVVSQVLKELEAIRPREKAVEMEMVVVTDTPGGVGQSHLVEMIIDQLVRGLVVRVAVVMAMVTDITVQVLPIVTVVVSHKVRGLETLGVQVQGQHTMTNRIKGHIHPLLGGQNGI